jgi:hypothetical protein
MAKIPSGFLESLKALGGSGLEFGKSGYQAGKSGYQAGKTFSKANPKTASAIGGSAGTLLLMKLLGKKGPEEDADEQMRKLKMSQMYGE